MFGHKKGQRILAYKIDSYYSFYIVTVYNITKCPRCGEIYNYDTIDQYERYAPHTQSSINEEEKILRARHIIPIVEAYAILEEKE